MRVERPLSRAARQWSRRQGTVEVTDRLMGEVFVGRARELDGMRRGVEAALAGRGSLYLVTGEPGIGKTRLAEEVCSFARGRGALTLWGRCWEAGGAPAYWPWAQLIRAYLRNGDPDPVLSQIGERRAYLAYVVPELDGGGGAKTPLPAEPERTRFSLFDAVTTFLQRAAAAQPLVIVLDDVHAADQPSLSLLQFFARELRGTPVLLIASCREVEARHRPELAALLGELAREGHGVPLRGLDDADVARFIERVYGLAPAPGLVSTVHHATNGNPLFVDEMLRVLRAEGRLEDSEGLAGGKLPIPVGVRETIRRRLAPFAEECRQLLTLAAVLGREFELPVLQHAARLQPERVLELLGEPIADGLVVEASGAGTRYAFSHALVRETLYEDATPAQRALLHGRIGEVLEVLYREDIEPQLAVLAHHFVAAAAAGATTKAVEYAARAGAHAVSRWAHEEGIAHYQRALALLGSAETSARRRCELLLALGEAQNWVNVIDRARETFEEATQIARRLHAPELLASAALGYGSHLAVQYYFIDPSLTDRVEEGLAAIGDADSALRACLLGRLAWLQYYGRARERAAALALEAMEIARRVDDHTALFWAVVARIMCVSGPDHLAERATLMDELFRLARRTGRKDCLLSAHAFRMQDTLLEGDIAATDRHIEAHMRLAAECGSPWHQWFSATSRTMRAIMEGRLDDAERLAIEAVTFAQQMPGSEAEKGAAQVFSTQMFVVHRERGHLDQLEPAVRAFVEADVRFHAWRCGLAYLYAELGRADDARVQFEILAQDDFAGLPRDETWLFNMGLLSQVCAFLGDARGAEAMSALLLPHAARNLNVGNAICLGSAARFLGLLAGVRGRWDEAVGYFEDALGMNARMGARLLVTDTQVQYARLLLERGRPGDGARVAQLAHAALATARALGMPVLAKQAAALAAQAERAADERRHGSPEPPAASVVAANEPVAASVFRREGEYWTVTYRGNVLRLQGTKGLLYIAELLRYPGREVHVLDLVANTDGRSAPVATPVATMSNERLEELGLHASQLGDAGELLDHEARSAYKRRLEDLREALDEAERFNDSARASMLREEIGFLARELAGGVGLGGRSRKAAAAAERARLSTTRAIKSALKRIAARDQALGYHLDRSIRTGTFCSYVPDPTAPVVWTF